MNIEQQNVGRKKNQQDREFSKPGRGKNTSNTKAREQENRGMKTWREVNQEN